MTSPSSNTPKRSLFFQQLQQAINSCQDRNQHLGLLIVKVRKFRQINIQLGYHTGDCLLNQLMKRIRRILRNDDMLSRIGDNEFAVVLPDIRNHGHAVLAASRILDVVKEPFFIDNRKIKPDVVIGVSLSPSHASTAEPLTQKADIALSQAKRNHQSVSVFLGDEQPQSPGDLISESELEQALENDEFEI